MNVNVKMSYERSGADSRDTLYFFYQFTLIDKKFTEKQNIINSIKNSCRKIVKGHKMLKCHKKGVKHIPEPPCRYLKEFKFLIQLRELH
jgi:hypothetical protein